MLNIHLKKAQSWDSKNVIKKSYYLTEVKTNSLQLYLRVEFFGKMEFFFYLV